jgi:hypothetical protein
MRLQQGPPSPEAMQSPNCKCKECSSSAAASIVLVPVQRPSAASQTPTAIMRTDAISNTIIIQCERAHLYPSTCPALGSALLRAQEVKDAYPCPNPPLQCTVALLKQVRRVWATSVLKGCLTARVSLPLLGSSSAFAGLRSARVTRECVCPRGQAGWSDIPLCLYEVRGTKVLYTCLCVRIRW